MRIDSPNVSNLTFQQGAAVGDSHFTGSFTGSFTGVGNFTGLTADSVAYANVTGKPTLISSSAQVTITESQISDLGTYSTATGVEDNADVTDTANVKTALNASLGGAASIGDSSDTITIPGNLTVQGTKTELQVTNLNVEDKNITVASGSADSAAADGAGLTVDGASATFTYSHTGTRWNMNKALDMGANTITTTGAIAGATLNTGQGANELYAMDQGVQTTDDVQFNGVQADSIGIGTAASGTTGEIRATGDITAYYSSDERLKENFAPLTGALDKVKAIGGYEFDWKDGIEDVVSKTGHDIGVKAQELQAQYPELVHERDNGYLAVDYVKLNAVLIEAVKELAAKVDELSK